jgi:hypothetical protein
MNWSYFPLIANINLVLTLYNWGKKSVNKYDKDNIISPLPAKAEGDYSFRFRPVWPSVTLKF